ncbi:MAG: prephenate dehydratase [Planctomycetaceae bacterium]|nr:prephenate dehydratase [Planctomycetaceae bacterium]
MSENGPNNVDPKLAGLRREIDQLDQQIVELLNARARVVVEVGKTKQAGKTPVYAPDREHAIFQRLAELNKGPLPQVTLKAIYRELMSGSFALERPLRIGYLGPQGSYSQMAAQRKFGASVEYLPLADIRAVFEEVSRGHCDLGIVPIENSVGGGVIDTLDCFIDAHVYICGEVILDVHHNLLANCPPEQIATIASKPEVFAQCRNWLGTFKKVDLLPVASSSKAAEMAVSTPGLAAIGSTMAAEHYGLHIVFNNIEDNPNNMTRFFVISPTPANRTGNDKTAIMFSTAHRAGALVAVLNVFSAHGISLTNIVTRPSKRRNWEYYFFVDAEGHCDDANFVQALAEARSHCGELHVLGSFPQARQNV